MNVGLLRWTISGRDERNRESYMNRRKPLRQSVSSINSLWLGTPPYTGYIMFKLGIAAMV